MSNLNTSLQVTIEKYGLPDVLAALAHRVEEIKLQTQSGIAKAKLADVISELNHSSILVQAAELTEVFEHLYGKPKITVAVYDYTREPKHVGFTVVLRTTDNMPDQLRERGFPSRADVDNCLAETKNRYNVVDVIEMVWFPPGHFKVA